MLDLARLIAEGRGEYVFVGRSPLQLLPRSRHLATPAPGHEAGHRWPAPRLARRGRTLRPPAARSRAPAAVSRSGSGG